MRNVSFLLFCVLIVVLTSCQTSLKVSKATKQKFLGGVEGSGWWNLYSVELQRAGNKDIRIDSVWLGDSSKGKWMDFSIVNENVSYPDKENIFRSHADKCFLRAEERFAAMNPGRADGLPKRRDFPNTVSLNAVPPPGFKRGMVIWYHAGGGSSRMLPVSEFEELETMALP